MRVYLQSHVKHFSKDVSFFLVLLGIEHSEKIYWFSNYQNRSLGWGSAHAGVSANTGDAILEVVSVFFILSRK